MPKMMEEIKEVQEMVAKEVVVKEYTPEQQAMIKKKKQIRSQVSFINSLLYRVTENLGYDPLDDTFVTETALKSVKMAKSEINALEKLIKDF